MAMVNAGDIRTEACAAEAIYEGWLYKQVTSAYQMTKTTACTDVPGGVAVDSSKDALGAARTLTAGDRHNFYKMGCGKVVKVAMIVSQTLHKNAAVYVAQASSTTNYGMADVVGTNSAIKIGHYVGTEGITTTAGQLVDVVLDVPIGAYTGGA